LIEDLSNAVTRGPLCIRRTRPADLDFVLRAEQDDGAHVSPWPRERHRAAIEDADEAHWMLCRADGGDPVGFVLLAGMRSPASSLELRRIVVADKGRGYGREALRFVKRFAFGDRDAHRLWLDVFEPNARARGLYESEGFRIEGKLRECVRAGDGYLSLIVMSMLRHEWRDA
jgi:RimJ/RimL family protein N-acetyltransferase